VSLRTVDTHVRRLRAKLGPHARVLTTIRGRGYRFDPGPDVRYLAA
jgi:DNA-binding response OmpR family regulator